MIARLIVLLILLSLSVSAETSLLSSIIVSNPSSFSTSDSTKIVSMQINFEGVPPENYLIEFIKESEETNLYLVFKNTQFNYFDPTGNTSEWLDIFADSTDNYYDDAPFTILKIHLTQKVSLKTEWKENELTLRFSDKRLFSNYKNVYWAVPLATITTGALFFLIETLLLPNIQ